MHRFYSSIFLLHLLIHTYRLAPPLTLYPLDPAIPGAGWRDSQLELYAL